MSTTEGPSVPGRTGSKVFLPVAASSSSSFFSDMLRVAPQGARNRATVKPCEATTLFDDLEERARRRLLVRIHRVDELEGFFLVPVLGHVGGVIGKGGLFGGLHDLDAIGLGERELGGFQTA